MDDRELDKFLAKTARNTAAHRRRLEESAGQPTPAEVWKREHPRQLGLGFGDGRPNKTVTHQWGPRRRLRGV